MATTRHNHAPQFGRLFADCPRCDELEAGAEPIGPFNRPARESGPKTTKHTHQVVFGRRVDGCPRCAELDAGAEPVRWNGGRNRTGGYPTTAQIHAHFASGGPHSRGACGPVCTFGQW